jgi:hypothetical protein
MPEAEQARKPEAIASLLFIWLGKRGRQSGRASTFCEEWISDQTVANVLRIYRQTTANQNIS